MVAASAIALTVVSPVRPAEAEPAIVHVPGDAGTIQAGIDMAVHGTTVVVAPGTYRENIRFNGKAIEVRSAAGPAVTVIDGGGDTVMRTAVAFYDHETRASVLRGFTIRDGRNGLDVLHSSPTITGNIITGNEGFDGGAFRLWESAALVQGNVIRANQATFGGGLYVWGAPVPEIVGNTIEANRALFDGGGIQVNGGADHTVVRNNLIQGNRANAGGGVAGGGFVLQNVFANNEAGQGGAVAFGVGTLANNTMVANRAPAGSAVHGTGSFLAVNNVISGPSTGPAVECAGTGGGRYFFNDIYNGTPTPVRWCQAFLGLVGNVSVDPRLRSDFGLHADSPAIDAGEDGEPWVPLPPTDANGSPRIVDGNGDGRAKPDMGAFEWPGTGFSPRMVAGPAVVAFGSLLYGTTATASVTVTGEGLATLHVGTPSVAGDPRIRVATNACAGVGIGLGESCTITLEFLATVDGPVHATVTIPSDGGSHTVTVSGAGDLTPFDYVQRTIEDVLGRTALSAESDTWAPKVADAQGRWEFATWLVSQADYRARLVAADSRAYLGHDPAPAMSRALVSAMANGASVELSAVIFLGSEEFFTLQGRSPERFMDVLFRRVLGRAAAAPELTAWANLIRSGYDRSITALTFILQPDARARLVDATYQRYVGHLPDVESAVAWRSLLAMGAPSEWVAAWVVGSEEYWSRATA
jgi:hypothetical protein